MGAAGTIHPSQLNAEPLVLADDDLALFVLNVGDGDGLVVRFPVISGSPSFAIVDSFRGQKTVDLVHALAPAQPVEGAPRLIRLVCATHPHHDHIAGLGKVLDVFAGQIDEFWDSGFRFTSNTYHRVITKVEAEASQGLQLLRPTAGFEVFHAGSLISVLSPSISLRNQYDTYGVDVNNASIVLRMTYPVELPSTDYPETNGNAPQPGQEPKSRTIILGGDAQTDAWGHVLEDFPHLQPDAKNWARAIGAKTGRQPLKCDLLKVSHHCSKRGVNLELVERLGDGGTGGPSNGPSYLVASCSTGAGSGYGFPHEVTQELLREVRNPQAQKQAAHPPDDELGIHYTSQVVDGTTNPAGSVAYVMKSDGSAHLYRLMDAVGAAVDLAQAQRVV